jgi:hypothetical protein
VTTVKSTSLAIYEPTSIAPTATSFSTKRATSPSKPSHVRIVSRSSGVERSDNPFVTNGTPWTTREITRLCKHANTPLDQLVKLFPGRTPSAVKSKRTKIGATGEKNIVWTREQDDRLRELCAAGHSWSEISRVTGIGLSTLRSRCLTKLLIRPNKPKVKLTGDPFVDAVRQRAAQDGIGMRALDREIGTGHYFRSNCEQRVAGGSPPDMNAIAKAVSFFGGELEINWRDE